MMAEILPDGWVMEVNEDGEVLKEIEAEEDYYKKIVEKLKGRKTNKKI